MEIKVSIKRKKEVQQLSTQLAFRYHTHHQLRYIHFRIGILLPLAGWPFKTPPQTLSNLESLLLFATSSSFKSFHLVSFRQVVWVCSGVLGQNFDWLRMARSSPITMLKGPFWRTSRHRARIRSSCIYKVKVSTSSQEWQVFIRLDRAVKIGLIIHIYTHMQIWLCRKKMKLGNFLSFQITVREKDRKKILLDSSI